MKLFFGKVYNDYVNSPLTACKTNNDSIKVVVNLESSAPCTLLGRGISCQNKLVTVCRV